MCVEAGAGGLQSVLVGYLSSWNEAMFHLYEVIHTHCPPSLSPSPYRNLLYSLPGRSPQFSVLRFSQEAVLHCNVTSRALKHNSAAKEVLCHSTMNQSLSLILRAIRSAERLVCFGMGLFENYPNDKK